MRSVAKKAAYWFFPVAMAWPGRSVSVTSSEKMERSIASDSIRGTSSRSVSMARPTLSV